LQTEKDIIGNKTNR